MKRHGNLFPQIADFGNLLEAARLAQRGKRFRADVLEFNYQLEGNLHAIRDELLRKTYTPGAYRSFVIFEPKRRQISAAPYRDRVVHHALVNVIGPIFDATLVETTYANRIEKGTHRALARFINLARRHRFVLQADVEKFFPSLDHDILRAKVRRKVKCADTLWLVDRILGHSNEQEAGCDPFFDDDDLVSVADRRRGLPIGNLTSQMWANVYLSDLDHAIAGEHGGRHYLRYVDDIALFGDDLDGLRAARMRMANVLAGDRLRLHPVKTRIAETRHGANFLGFRVLPDRVRVRQENLRRARRRLRDMQGEFAAGRITVEQVSRSVQSWCAHLDHGDTWRLREKVLSSLGFSRC